MNIALTLVWTTKGEQTPTNKMAQFVKKFFGRNIFPSIFPSIFVADSQKFMLVKISCYYLGTRLTWLIKKVGKTQDYGNQLRSNELGFCNFWSCLWFDTKAWV